MKIKYKVTFNGTEFTRSSTHDYSTAGIYENIETGELYGKPSFAKSGNTPQPYCPAGIRDTERTFFKCYPRSKKYREMFNQRIANWDKKMKQYRLLIQPVERMG